MAIGDLNARIGGLQLLDNCIKLIEHPDTMQVMPKLGLRQNVANVYRKNVWAQIERMNETSPENKDAKI